MYNDVTAVLLVAGYKLLRLANCRVIKRLKNDKFSASIGNLCSAVGPNIIAKYNADEFSLIEVGLTCDVLVGLNSYIVLRNVCELRDHIRIRHLTRSAIVMC